MNEFSSGTYMPSWIALLKKSAEKSTALPIIDEGKLLIAELI